MPYIVYNIVDVWTSCGVTKNNTGHCMWPTMMLITYMTGLQLYSLCRFMEVYRHMSTYRYMGTFRNLGALRHGGIQMYGGVWMYGVYSCIRGVLTYRGRYMGCMDVWGTYGLGAYIHPQTYRQPDIPPHACQLHLKEYVKVFLSLVIWSWSLFIT